MKKIILNLSITTGLLLTNANADIFSPSTGDSKGQGIFEAKGCVVCHKMNMDTIGPSLRTISTAYFGRESTIITYLKGQGEAIVYPERAAVMDPQLVKIGTLLDNEIKDLAEYIISASDRPY